MLARQMKQAFAVSQNSYFEKLMTKFTTPEEIFGPLSITKLEKDLFERNVEGYLPSAKIAFLDEIFKANSAILNSLLTIINERVYQNGTDVLKVPLLSILAASNELPSKSQTELAALYDRFLIRQHVDYLPTMDLFLEMAFSKDYHINESELYLTSEDIAMVQERRSNV
jgi:MoxR-like ATPase